MKVIDLKTEFYDEYKNDLNKLVSIVIPVYESAKFLRESLDSIINQTYKNIEIICVYDKSSDNSLEILEEYALKDKRVIIIKSDKKIGISHALNLAIKASKGKYIARMDSDDIAVLSRIEEQYTYMEANPQTAVCGSFIRKFGRINRLVKCPVCYEEIKANLLFNCCMFHPTVFIRKHMLEKYNLFYNEDITVCEDFDLWVKCIKLFEFHNIPKALLKYREHDKNLSKSKSVETTALDIIGRQCEYYLNISSRDKAFQIIFNPAYLDFLLPELDDAYRFVLQKINTEKVDIKFFKKYLHKAIIKKLKKCFKKYKSLVIIFNMFRYNIAYAILFLFLNFLLIKRCK